MVQCSTVHYNREQYITIVLSIVCRSVMSIGVRQDSWLSWWHSRSLLPWLAGQLGPLGVLGLRHRGDLQLRLWVWGNCHGRGTATVMVGATVTVRPSATVTVSPLLHRSCHSLIENVILIVSVRPEPPCPARTDIRTGIPVPVPVLNLAHVNWNRMSINNRTSVVYTSGNSTQCGL